MILTIFFDSWFISELGFSLNLGVNGIAFTNMIVYSVMFIYMAYKLFKQYSIKLKEYFNDLDFSWTRE